MKKILLAGGTGFIGTYLIPFLIKKGYEFLVLTRKKLKDKPNIKYFLWDVENGFMDEKAFEDVDAIINLTGANIGAKRWTKSRKKEIVNSRVDSINLLYHYVSQNHYPIKSFISASATGFYGAVTGNQIFTEESSPGKDFLSSVCQKWEKAAQQFENMDCRVVVFRQGVVLGKEDGMYKKLASLAKWRINPAVGNGKQYLPWIDIKDQIRLFAFVLENETMKGVFNAVASEHITMNEFIRKLMKSIDKKSILPNAPSFLVKFALGEMSSMVLEGSRISNQKIKRAGFTFLYDNLDKSLP